MSDQDVPGFFVICRSRKMFSARKVGYILDFVKFILLLYCGPTETILKYLIDTDYELQVKALTL